MLHPHVPEALHGFGKHLFATFLGLLMALGLESCHQEHERKKIAATALADVEREIRSNLLEVQKVIQAYKETPDALQKGIDFFNTIREARLSNRPWSSPAKEFTLSGSYSFSPATIRSSAWSMALASQSVARFPHGKGIAYAELYEEFQKFRSLQERPVDLASAQLVPLLTPSTVTRLDLEDLRRVIWGLNSLKVQASLMRMYAIDLEATIQKKLGGTQAPS